MTNPTEAVELTQPLVEELMRIHHKLLRTERDEVKAGLSIMTIELCSSWLARQDELKLLARCREWMRGDKWRDSDIQSQREAWKELMDKLNAALSKEPPQ